MTTRRCTNTKSIDGGSCSERVPCDGAVVMVRGVPTMIGGCGEPCSFVMARPDEREAAFRAGFAAGVTRAAYFFNEDEYAEDINAAWLKFRDGEKR